MRFTGIIVEESLADKSPLQEVAIVKTEVEPVTDRHNTPWLEKWTMHTVEVLEEKAEALAEKIMKSLEKDHAWYADYNNDQFHFIIFKDKVFKVDVTKPEQYKAATKHGIKLGIPEHQVTFTW